MTVARFMVLAGAGAVAAATMTAPLAPLPAQGLPRGIRTAQQVNTGPRLMVANPFAFSAGDSLAAVEIGTAVRDQLRDRIGDDYNIVEQEQMNEALVQYGYPRDAIL